MNLPLNDSPTTPDEETEGWKLSKHLVDEREAMLSDKEHLYEHYDQWRLARLTFRNRYSDVTRCVSVDEDTLKWLADAESKEFRDKFDSWLAMRTSSAPLMHGFRLPVAPLRGDGRKRARQIGGIGLFFRSATVAFFGLSSVIALCSVTEALDWRWGLPLVLMFATLGTVASIEWARWKRRDNLNSPRYNGKPQSARSY